MGRLRPQIPAANPVVPTPVQWAPLSRYLDGYDKQEKTYIITGFQEGFKLDFIGQQNSQVSPNLKTALEHPEIVSQKLEKERVAGRIAGPFEECPFPDFRISPLGLVEKKQAGQFRLIHHLSYPRGKGLSVNDGINKDSVAVSYAGIEEAIAKMKSTGRHFFMSKTDMKAANRMVPIHPNFYNLQGFSWQGDVYFDRCLVMGCSQSSAIFERISTSLEWVAKNKLNCSEVVHILDDFLFIEPSETACLHSLNNFLRFCTEVGIPIAEDKTFQPSPIMEFVGITLDSLRMEARLPESKITKCIELLEIFLGKTTCKKKELESLIGYLNFCCSVVLPGRAFLRRLISLMLGTKEPFMYISISPEVKADLRMWLNFVQNFNGRCLFLNDRFLSSSALSLFTDAAASSGYGAIYGSYWLYGLFPKSWSIFNITFLELYPIVVAVNVWGHLWKNHCITFHTDNLALVYILNRQTSKDKDIMKLVRHLVLACLRYNVSFQSSHIIGIKNTEADCLSRQQVEEFKRLRPQSRTTPSPVPPHLLPENFFNT